MYIVFETVDKISLICYKQRYFSSNPQAIYDALKKDLNSLVQRDREMASGLLVQIKIKGGIIPLSINQ